MKKYIIVPASVAIVIGAFLIASSLLHSNHVGGGNPTSSTTRVNYFLSISNGTMQVEPRSYTFYHFAAPDGSSNARVSGDFALQGNGSSVRVYLLDDANFVNWKSGHQFNAYYDSGQNTTDTIDVSVPSGKTLYLIYDNSLSPIPSKTVFSRVNLYYDL